MSTTGVPLVHARTEKAEIMAFAEQIAVVGHASGLNIADVLTACLVLALIIQAGDTAIDVRGRLFMDRVEELSRICELMAQRDGTPQ